MKWIKNIRNVPGIYANSLVYYANNDILISLLSRNRNSAFFFWELEGIVQKIGEDSAQTVSICLDNRQNVFIFEFQFKSTLYRAGLIGLKKLQQYLVQGCSAKVQFQFPGL